MNAVGHPVFLNGGGGRYETAVIAAIAFVVIFTFSFAFGRPPGGVWGWFKASLPRLAIVGLFSAALFLASTWFGGDSGASMCDQGVPALSGDPVTAERLQTAIVKFRQLAGAVAQGDQALADSLFFGDAHNVTHDIDGLFRSVNPDLAKQLCKDTVALENEFAGARRPETLAGQAQNVATALTMAASELGSPQ